MQPASTFVQHLRGASRTHPRYSYSTYGKQRVQITDTAGGLYLHLGRVVSEE